MEALAAGDTSAARLERYHDDWMEMLGDDHIRFHRLKDALSKFDDAFFDNLARTVNRIAYEKRTLRQDLRERADASSDAAAGGGEVFRVRRGGWRLLRSWRTRMRRIKRIQSDRSG